jgi:hypothetical protein
MSMAMAVSMGVTMSRAVPVIVSMAMIVVVMRRHSAVKAFLPEAGNIHT